MAEGSSSTAEPHSPVTQKLLCTIVASLNPSTGESIIRVE